MHMTKLASLFPTAIPGLVSGATLVAEANTQSDNGQANSLANASQVAPDICENVVSNNVDNSNVNLGDAVLHSNSPSMNHEGMTKDEIHKNTICKDGRCPNVNKEVGTGDGANNDTETKTDGTTQ